MPMQAAPSDKLDVKALMAKIGAKARSAARALQTAGTEQKNRFLLEGATMLRQQVPQLLAANAKDMEAGRAGKLDDAMLDRLQLSDARIEAIARSLEDIAALPDPVGQVIQQWDRPNGLRISRVRVPIGVIGVIYESRPNVTADAGALCVKSGNAVILRGGSESFHSSRAIIYCLERALAGANLPIDAIQLVPTTDRAAVGEMLTMTDSIDLIVPRGGRSLIERVSRHSRVPLLKHFEGLCHVYVDRDADRQKAVDIVANAKMRRVGVCGAAETLLVDRVAMPAMLSPILDRLISLGCEVRGDAAVRKLDKRVKPATDEDWDTEYLAPVIAVAAVDGVDAAIDHIARHGTQHTEAIITENEKTAEHFLAGVDSAIVMHNASTQFADGGEFGLGAEIGISTGKLHARGPVGLVELTTYKNLVRGTGQIRP